MNLEEQNIEFQRILCQIRSKNGLPYVVGIDMLDIGANENSSHLMEYSNINSQYKKSRGNGDKIGKNRRLGIRSVQQDKDEASMKTEQEVKQQEVTSPDQASGNLSLIQSTYGTRATSNLWCRWPQGVWPTIRATTTWKGFPGLNRLDSGLKLVGIDRSISDPERFWSFRQLGGRGRRL